MSIEIKSPEQLRKMRAAGLVVAEGLRRMQEATAVGVTTAEIDAVGRDVLAEHGATSNFLGYGSEYGTPFPGVSCISVNDELVHGIPGNRVIRDGDLVSIDFGAVLDGWHGDAARSFVVGEARAEDLGMIEATRQAMWAGIAAVRDGGRVGDVSRAIEWCVKHQPRRYGSLRDYTGHGIGSRMHMEPDVPNQFRFRPNPRLGVGMAIAVEPMLTLGTIEWEQWDDDWTIVTADRSRTAQFEHTIVVTEDGAEILTLP